MLGCWVQAGFVQAEQDRTGDGRDVDDGDFGPRGFGTDAVYHRGGQQRVRAVSRPPPSTTGVFSPVSPSRAPAADLGLTADSYRASLTAAG